MRDYKLIFEQCKNSLKKKNAEGISLLEKAFLFAEKVHAGQIRKSGEPYILHPVEVMEILEKLDFDTDVLCGALLHDVIEDCNISKQQLEQTFNKNIAQIVDCVSELENVGEEKWETELKTYQKLVSIGKENLFGFYIKFADRVNNMSTLSIFPYYKQLDKVKQTLKYVLPIAKILKSQYFVSKLSSMCYFYSLEEGLQKKLKTIYDEFVSKTQLEINKFSTDIKLEINNILNKSEKGILKNIYINPLEILEIKNNIFNFYNIKNEQEINPSCFVSSPIYELDIIIDDYEDLNKLFFNLCSLPSTKHLFNLCGYQKDEFGQYFIIETPKRLKFKVFISNSENFLLRRNGCLEGVSWLLEEDFEQKIETDFITVYTPSNKPIYLPKNSTVLDFAFKIHKDFGFSVKHAYLNDSPQKSPIWTQVSPNDKINLEIARDNDGQLVNIAKIRWLAYVNCELSIKSLVKYFEKMYE